MKHVLSGLFFLGAVAAVSAAASEEARVLTVSAEGKEKLTPTLADVRLAVEFRAESAEQARRELETRSARLMDFLRDEEVERLETTAIRIFPVYRYEPRSRERIEDGYQAQAAVSFRTGVEEAGLLAARAIEEGANRVDGMTFTSSDDALEEARRSAMQTAVRKAVGRAEAALAALDFQLAEIVTIDVDAPEVDRFFPMARAQPMQLEAADASPGFDVEAGEQEITARVRLKVRWMPR